MNPPIFAHGHLRLYLLSLLAETGRAETGRGMHGYELIQALGDRFGGTYAPSAGTVYPRLSKLEQEGLVTKVADGRKTVYGITDLGRAELAARESELARIESDVTDSVRRLADEVRASVNDAMRTLRADLAAAAREARTDARTAVRVAQSAAAACRVDGSLQLQQAEALLTSFRANLRADLRVQLSRDSLPAEAVEVLRSGLDDVRASVLKTFA